MDLAAVCIDPAPYEVRELAELLTELRERGWRLQGPMFSDEGVLPLIMTREVPRFDGIPPEVAELTDVGTDKFNPVANPIDVIPMVDPDKLPGLPVLAAFSGSRVGDVSEGTNNLIKALLAVYTSYGQTRPPGPTPAPAQPAVPAAGAERDAAAAAEVEPEAPPADIEALENIHEKLFAGLSKAQKQTIASEYFRRVIRDEASEGEAAFWEKAPELYLLNELEAADADRQSIVRRMLLLKAGLKSTQIALDRADLETAQKRNLILDVGVNIAKEALEGMVQWRALAKPAKNILVATTIFSGLMIIWLFVEADLAAMNGYVALTMFVLAVFAVSPSVILLLQRPLKGIDEFMPGGKLDVPAADDGEDESAAPSGGAAAEAAKGNR